MRVKMKSKVNRRCYFLWSSFVFIFNGSVMHDSMNFIYEHWTHTLDKLFLKLANYNFIWPTYDHDHPNKKEEIHTHWIVAKCVKLCESIYNHKLWLARKVYSFLSRKCTRRTLMSCYEFVPFFFLSLVCAIIC